VDAFLDSVMHEIYTRGMTSKDKMARTSCNPLRSRVKKTSEANSLQTGVVCT